MNGNHMYRGANVLITGGLGMIGSTLAHKLVALGAEVTILDAFLPQLGANSHNLQGIDKLIDVTIGDIRDTNLVRSIVRDRDYIFNLAAQVSYIDSMADPLLDLDINCGGQLILLEACRLRNSKAKIIFTGSRLQYGRVPEGLVGEAVPNNPLMFYGVHKMAGEKYHLLYHQVYGLRTTVARLTNPYGPRHNMKHSKYGIVNWFIRQAMDGQTIRVFGDGAQIRDYIFIDDVADALLRLGTSEAADGEVFNVGSGQGTMFADMVEAVLDTVGSGHHESVPWPDDYQRTESGDFVADISKIKAQIGWRPTTSLLDGIRRTYEYYLERRRFYWPDPSFPAEPGEVLASELRRANPVVEGMKLRTQKALGGRYSG